MMMRRVVRGFVVQEQRRGLKTKLSGRELIHVDEEARGPTSGIINWYPGHIAKAERDLQSYLKRIDVVVEARDARIARTTAHPSVAEWIGPRPRVVAYTFVDQCSEANVYDWRVFHKPEKKMPRTFFWVDAKRGTGEIGSIKVAIQNAAKDVNKKRALKGIKPRAVRCAVIGFPNVGKSALINKLAGRRVAKSENRAGVTRQLQWIRPRDFKDLELLDSPGIIPARQIDQTAASRLACAATWAAAPTIRA